MGVTVSAAQAARLVHRHERVVRGWIEAGKLDATKSTNGTYVVSVDDLAHVRVRGVVIDQVLLDAMRTERAALLRPFQEQVEETLRDLERRMKLLEMQRQAVTTLIADGVSGYGTATTSSRADAPSAATRTATLARRESTPATVGATQTGPGESVYGVSIYWYFGQISKGTCVKYAGRHGASENTAEKKWTWPEVRRDAATVIRFIHERMNRPAAMLMFQECDAWDCPCHELTR